MTNQYAIEAELSRDSLGHDPLPRLIGPFDTREVAERWVEAQGDLWGSWMVVPLAEPKILYPEWDTYEPTEQDRREQQAREQYGWA